MWWCVEGYPSLPSIKLNISWTRFTILYMIWPISRCVFLLSPFNNRLRTKMTDAIRWDTNLLGTSNAIQYSRSSSDPVLVKFNTLSEECRCSAVVFFETLLHYYIEWCFQFPPPHIQCMYFWTLLTVKKKKSNWRFDHDIKHLHQALSWSWITLTQLTQLTKNVPSL